MLEKLIIKNYLLLKNIEIDLPGGFNIITGETGAGKSILINALQLLMGGRADYAIISKNKEKMIIEGLFEINKENIKEINKILISNGIDEISGATLIIRRELYAKAYSRCFINDSPAGTNILKEIGDVIIDIHSQNEHQSLLKKEIHIELLDRFLIKTEGKKFKDKIDYYRLGFENLINRIKEYEDINEKKEELDNKRNFTEFRLKEITEVNPETGEDDRLESELKTGENIESIQQSIAAAYGNLYEETGSATEKLKTVEKELLKITEFNSEARKILESITGSATVLDEAARQLQKLNDNISFNPERVEEIRERLYRLQFLKKKYGGSLEEVIKLKNSLEMDLTLVENFDEKAGALEEEIKAGYAELNKKAMEISKTRKDKAGILEAEVEKVFEELGFESGKFSVQIQKSAGGSRDESTAAEKLRGKYELNANGIDDAEFMVKINKGDEFQQLRKTASGGEVSRIMLAVKAVLAEADKTDILVFDEIDTGISGRIAQKAGRVIKNLAKYHQVIAITHLAQIAALAEGHFEVSKETDEEGQAVTKIRALDKSEKVIEVAKLLSGENVTDASIKSAKELMGK